MHDKNCFFAGRMNMSFVSGFISGSQVRKLEEEINDAKAKKLEASRMEKNMDAAPNVILTKIIDGETYYTQTSINFMNEEIKELESRLSEAEELLTIYNDFLKRDNKSAEKLGTTIDDYFSKYSKEG